MSALPEPPSRGTQPSGCPFSSKDFNPFAPPLLDSPHPTLAQARRELPIFFSEVLGAWIITRYEDAYAVLQDPKRFSSNVEEQARQALHPEVRRALEEGGCHKMPVLFEDPPDHTRSRGILTRLFAPDSIASLEPRIRAMAEELVQGFIHQRQADLIPHFTYPLPLRVILDWMGLPLQRTEELRRWSTDLLKVLSLQPMSLEEQHECVRNILAARRYVGQLIAERAEHPRGDGLSVLAQRLTEKAGLGAEDLATLVMMLLVAGHDTTTGLLSEALRLLAEQPALWERLREQPQLIPSVVEEILRYESPTLGPARLTTEPVELGGVSLPAGARLMVVLPSANRDEQRFAESERFNPERPNPTQHLSFGKGIHVCVGAGLARLEARVALEVLTQRMAQLRLAEPPQRVPGVVRHYARLLLAWEPAASAS